MSGPAHGRTRLRSPAGGLHAEAVSPTDFVDQPSDAPGHGVREKKRSASAEAPAVPRGIRAKGGWADRYGAFGAGFKGSALDDELKKELNK